MPATDRLLGPCQGQSVLDVACGNGNYARRLARAGAAVTAIDFSGRSCNAARERTTGLAIDYRLCDATDEAALLTLGRHRFDAVVCSMAMMDMPTIDPLLRRPRAAQAHHRAVRLLAVAPLLQLESSAHDGGADQRGWRRRQEYGVRVTEYIKPSADLSSGILNQPEPHYMFHRPLSDVFASCFRAGFVVTGFEEPSFSKDAGEKNAFAWAKRPAIPPAVVVRVAGSA